MDQDTKAYLDRMLVAITDQFARLHERIDGVEQRLGQRMDKLEQRMNKLEARMGSLEQRFDSLRVEMNERFIAVDARFRALEVRMDQFEKRITAKVDDLAGQVAVLTVRVDKEFEEMKSSMARLGERVTALELQSAETNKGLVGLREDMGQRFRTMNERMVAIENNLAA